MLTESENKPKRTNPILWFLFAIVIPIIVAGVLAVLIMTMAGVNVSGWVQDTAQKIPVVSSFIPTEEEKDFQAETEKSQKTIADQEKELESLHNHINDLESTIEQLELEIVKVEQKAANEEETVEESMENEEDVQMKQLAASFKNMKSKQAALIFQDLDKNTAISVLQQLSNDVRGGILEAMDPKEAAKLAELFLE